SVGDGIDGSSIAVGTSSPAALTTPSATTPAAGTPSSCTSSTPSSTCYSTIIPSKSGVSTPEHPLPTLLMFANTFWVRAGDEYFVTSVAVKKVNDVMRLQALVNKKKVVISEATIRDALRLDDAEGIECLPNEEIFAELARMGYEKPLTKLTFYKAFFSSQWKFLIHYILQCMSAKRTSWNEFSSSMASAVICLPTEKPLLKDLDGEDVDVHTYISMSGSLMYLTLSRPDIMFAVCACARFQVTPKASHLHVVKRIFRYLKGKPHLGLWYPKDSPFDLVAYSDSDYAGASLDRMSTTGGCQFFGCRLISWQYKKQTVVATSSTEAEYVATAINTPRSDGDRLELMELTIFLLPKVGIRVNVVDLQVSAVRHMLLLFSLTNWCCSLSAVRKQVGDLSIHTTKYTSSTLNKKVFANMRRVGKGFSGVKTPLFEGILVEQQDDEEGDADENVKEVNTGDAAYGDDSVAHGEVPTVAKEQSIPSPTPPTPPPQPTQDIHSTSQDKIAQALEITKLKQRIKKLERKNKASKLKRLRRVGTTQRIETSNDTVMDNVSKQGRMIPDMDADVDVILNDAKEVAVEKSVDVDESVDVQGRQADAARRRKGLVIRDPQETVTPSTIVHSEAKSKDKGKGVLVKEPKPLKKQAQIEQDKAYARELEAELNKNIDWDETEAQARKNMMIYLRNIIGFKMDYFKGMTYDDIRPIFEKHFDSNVAFLQKIKERMDEKDSRALKRLNESQEDKAAKKQKLDEEVEEL
nr:uncharacterized mitochondrial protein AtMg00810-like [Tanacetum cinerariifolium]